MFPQYSLNFIEIGLGRQDDTTGAHNRFGEERGHGVRDRDDIMQYPLLPGQYGYGFEDIVLGNALRGIVVGYEDVPTYQIFLKNLTGKTLTFSVAPSLTSHDRAS